jgi:hypothetical protein
MASYFIFPLGHQQAGTIVLADLSGAEADGFLVTGMHLARFRRGLVFAPYDYQRTTASPARMHLVVPTTTNWALVVVPVGGYVQVADPQILPAA